MRVIRVLLAAGLALSAAACAAQPTAVNATLPAVTAAAGVASPTASYPTLVVPTPSPDTGVVTGRVVVRLTGEPMPGITVYLANRVPLEPGPGYVISHTQEGSPHATADAEGNFALAAPPGEYALVVWTPINAKVVADPADPTKELVVANTAGETVSLGDVVVDWP